MKSPPILALKEKDYRYVAIDAEWVGDDFITAQLAFSNESGEIMEYIIFARDTRDALEIDLKQHNSKPVTVIEYPIGSLPLLDIFESLPPELTCIFFYSPRDLESFLGKEKWFELLVGNKVNKRSNITVKSFKHKDCRIKFKDLYGCFSSSLKDAYQLVNLDTSSGKDYIELLNIDKSRMDLFKKNHPIEFYKYCLEDLNLHELYLRLIDLVHQLLREVFDIEETCYSFKTYPSSIGALVHDIWLRYLNKYFPDVLRVSCYLTTSPDYSKKQLLEKIRDWSLNKKADGYEITKAIQRSNYLIHGLGAASIPAFFPGNYGSNDTSPFGAVVQGGRAVNEVPDKCKFENIADIDLNSAYGSTLRNFNYAVGIPTIYSSTPDESSNVLTLKEFLNKYDDELIEGLFVIYVSGMLEFQQDFMHSKYGIKTNTVGAKLLKGDYEEDDDVSYELLKSHLGGEFILTTKQINLGIITSEVLEAIRKISSNQEIKSWMNLKVDLAVYYPKSLQVPHEQWCEEIVANRGYRKAKEDTRNKHWCVIPFEGFIGSIVDKRKHYKKLSKTDKSYNALQLMLKLITNTSYGIMASPFFASGNTVVANNITAKARCGVWKMSKACGCKLTITDGGIYELFNIPYLKTENKSFKKPGFEKLYLKDKNWNKLVEYKPLINDERLMTLIKDNPNEYQYILDTAAKNHIDAFWEYYDLKLGFDVEHKISNTGYLAVTNPFGKVDYIIKSLWDQDVIKIRGVSAREYATHPKVELLRAIIDNRNINFHYSTLVKLIGVNEFIKNPNKDKLPGMEVTVPYLHKPKSHGNLLFEDYSTYSKREKAYKEKVRRYNIKFNDTSIELRPRFL